MMCQYRFISFSQVTALVEDIDHVVSYAGVYGKSVYLLFNFAMSLKN